MSITTFEQVCGSQSGFLQNSTAMSWANSASSISQLPLDLILAQWFAEGAAVCGTSSSVCNNPANCDSGQFTRCGSYTATGSCTVPNSSNFANYSTGLAGAEMYANVMKAGFCSVIDAYNNPTLSTGGAELKSFGESLGLVISNNTYNAAYALGVSGWDPTDEYEDSKHGGTSTVPGSFLIRIIADDNMGNLDYIA